MSRETPMIRQYREIKDQNRDKILFFRVGDFYEMFYEDAKIGARELEITLTSRETGKDHHVPLAGFPYHALDSYLGRLIERGYKVAICDQVEDPKLAKGLVKREIVRVITPGTVIESALLDEKTNNYLVAVYGSHGSFGLATVDVSTGDFFLADIRGKRAGQMLSDELFRLCPAEIIVNESAAAGSALADALSRLPERVSVNPMGEKNFAAAKAKAVTLAQFGVQSLESLGCAGMPAAVAAAGAALCYLQENQQSSLSHLRRPTIYAAQGFMALDSATRRNLELTRTIRGESKQGSLLWVLDKTRTAMGGRLLRRWLEQPLLNMDAVNRRLDAVEELAGTVQLLEDLNSLLERAYDLERLMGRINCGSANARDLVALRGTLDVLPAVRHMLEAGGGEQLKSLAGRLPQLESLASFLKAAIVDEPPLGIKEGGVINAGFHPEVDRLRRDCGDGREYILGLEQRERERTGIKSLKVGYNRVFGYYIEITRANDHLAPDDYLRKQTLANAERYLTPELKEYEALVLGAEEKICALEYDIFLEVRGKAAAYTHAIQEAADVIANIDVFASLARVARDNRYIRPLVDDSDVIEIRDGRHPVVEKVLKEQLFVANDTNLDGSKRRILIITGPNMAGKSTYMRQVALIVLLAQIGSFVPAKKARIGLVDRIFTRIGAADDLVGGQSTFMLEMSEVANILHGATSRSLVLLDEVGRGTSTFDGISIARSVVEYLQRRVKARTLFATHYHELTSLADELDGVINLATAVKERGEDILFLHKVVAGSVDRSYGIQVARLAGLPPQVIDRARELLAVLECTQAGVMAETAAAAEPGQLQLFVPDPELASVLDVLENTDIMTTTPLEAMQFLYRLQQALKKGERP
ncbi:MAG: DNA mismatch repair protein MutS [Dethiobacter sp.]|nr:DNA mismatch repair protein MutS [Dethiobacter sp.]